MSFFEIDYSLETQWRTEISELLFAFAYNEYVNSDNHFLSYCEFANDPVFTAANKYLSFKKPMTLYTVSTETQSIPASANYSPGFEMAIV